MKSHQKQLYKVTIAVLHKHIKLSYIKLCCY